jgi:predicted flap endonuclease-1-like 5' DNA nuclease
MEFDREAKNMIAIIAFVAAIAFGINYVVVDQPDRSFISWSVGLFVVAVLFWIWMRRDDLAEKREGALKAAEDAARQAEELAKKAQDKAEVELEKGKEKIEVLDEKIHDYTDDLEETEEEVEETVEEVVEEVAASDEPDDLSKVEGIGPVYQSILKDAGVGTFAAIAAKSTDELEAIIKAAGKRRPASIVTWAQQAALAAKGDWDGLQKLQDSLDGGRPK